MWLHLPIRDLPTNHGDVDADEDKKRGFLWFDGQTKRYNSGVD